MPRNRAGFERHQRLTSRTVLPPTTQHGGGRFDNLQEGTSRHKIGLWERERFGTR